MTIAEVRKSDKRNIKFSEITEIKEGRHTKSFKRHKLKKNEQFKEDLSFSIIAKNRTLDLEATAEVEVRLFISFMKIVLATQQRMDEKTFSKSQNKEKNP